MLTSYIKAEQLKSSHTVLAKLFWVVPLVSVLISSYFSNGNVKYYQMNQFNWWYTTFFPVLILTAAAFLVQRERKVKNRIMSALPLELKKVWAAKVLRIVGILLRAVILLYCAQEIISRVLAGGGTRIISSQSGLMAVLLCVVLSLWQIPVWMFVNEKLGFTVGIVLGLICNIGLGLVGASADMWMLNPFYYSNRLMCPLLGILPNNLPAVPESMYYFEGALDMSVIPVGVILSIVLFVFTFLVTAVWYQRKGIKGWEN